MVLLFNTRSITFAVLVELIMGCIKNNCPSWAWHAWGFSLTQETKCNNWENTKENKRITLRNSSTKTTFQRFMANTSFKRAGADLVTTMTSGILYSRYFNGGARLAQWWDRALALHHYGPGSDPGVDAICGLSFWVRVFLGESKNGFVTRDHTDSSLPKKPEDPKKDHLPWQRHVLVLLVGKTNSKLIPTAKTGRKNQHKLRMNIRNAYISVWNTNVSRIEFTPWDSKIIKI